MNDIVLSIRYVAEIVKFGFKSGAWTIIRVTLFDIVFGRYVKVKNNSLSVIDLKW